MQVTGEGPIKITKATVDAAWRRRKKDQRLIVRDKDCRGLALVVNATAMRWEYAYRPRGTDPVTKRRWPNKTVTLGNPASLSVDDVRIEANRIKGQTAAGADPAAEKKAKAEEERRQRGATLTRLMDDYAKALPKRPKMRGGGLPSPRYVSEEVAQVRMALAVMDADSLPVAQLDAVAIRRMVDGTADRAATARARFGALSRFMDWCQDTGHIVVNPCAQIARSRRPRAPQARAHFLVPSELGRLWHAAEDLRDPVWRDLVRFLIVVPCRRNEATRMEWSHVVLGAAEWRQPSILTKNRDPHRIHLHALALDVLQSRRRLAAEAQADGDAQQLARTLAAAQPSSGLVFPAPVSGAVVDTFTDLKAAMIEATKPKEGEVGQALDGWTWHDFRRSFATALGEAGIPEAVADAVLNHRQAATRGGVLGVYQRASRWPEQVKAMELWGKLLTEAITDSKAPTNMVPMVAHVG